MRFAIQQFWGWVDEHIKGILITACILTFVEATNRWGLIGDSGQLVFAYYEFSEAMDWVWQIDIFFTGITFIGWVWGKINKFLNNFLSNRNRK